MDSAPLIAIVERQIHHEHVRVVRERRHRIRELRAQRAAAAAAATSPSVPTTSSSPTSYTPPSGALSSDQIAAYARAAGFPESVIPTMVAIAYRESGGYPGAINSSSGACGLWQLYPCPGPDALDPARNAAWAYAKYAASGLAPWGG
jgi:SLT domain-containing protein